MSHDDDKEESVFSIYEFRDWISKQNTDDLLKRPKTENKVEKNYCGREVHPRVSRKKLMSRVDSDDPLVEDLVDEFIESGGIISEVNGKTLSIETDSGYISLPRFCVKIKKES